MKRDAGDIIDRFSIAHLKERRIGEPENIKEHDLFRQGYANLQSLHPEIDLSDYLNEMTAINAMIWDLESAVRKGELDDNPLEVGLRAIQIRKVNAKRIALKNKINLLVGEGVQDVRKDHSSAQ